MAAGRTFRTLGPIPQEMVSIIVKGFSSLHIDNLHREQSNLTIDGIEYGLKAGNTQISWQDKPTPKFDNLIKWYEETVNKFGKLFL